MNPKAYRPVALLNCLGKILEKLMAARLSYLAEAYGLLHEDQIGGRRQRSAIDAAMALTHEIDHAKHRKEIVSVLLMDVRGAFDNVAKTRLLNTMRELRIPNPMVAWIDSFLSHRTTALAFDGKKEAMSPVQTGIPQGSPVSPILFLLYLRPLFDELEKRQPITWAPSYIDDVALVVKGNSKASNARELEKAALIAFQWAAYNAVLFDDPKTELLHFHSKRDFITKYDETVTLPNQTIISPGTKGVSPEVVRWIGVWFDRKLTFSHHVKMKEASGKKALGALARLANTEAGLSLQAVRQLYLACVIPVCDFGAEVWWRNQKVFVSRFDKIQNAALRKILGAFRATPSAAMLNEAAIAPTDVRLDHVQRKYAIRVLTLPHNHPIWKRCPSTFPPYNESQEDDEEDTGGTSWDAPPKAISAYQSRLTRVLSMLRDWISPATEIETYSTTACAPWEESHIATAIPPDTKEEAAKAHGKQHTLLTNEQNRSHNLIAYSDDSMLVDTVGAGV
jgi:hypothetical protein